MMEKLINKYLFYYILSVLVFGFIYWSYPSSFIYHDQLNLLPDQRREVDSMVGPRMNLKEVLIEEERIIRSFKPILHSIDSVNSIIEHIENQIDTVVAWVRYVGTDLVGEYMSERVFLPTWACVDYSIDGISRPIRNYHLWKFENINVENIQSIDDIEYLIDQLENTDSNDINDLQYLIENDKLEHVVESILHRRHKWKVGSYYAMDQNKRDSCIKLLSGLYVKLDSLGRNMRENILAFEKLKGMDSLSDNLYILYSKYFDRLKKDFTFFDFCYFSASNASTLTFGEIVPNSRNMRVVIIIQVILSLILFAGYINRIYEKQERNTRKYI